MSQQPARTIVAFRRGGSFEFNDPRAISKAGTGGRGRAPVSWNALRRERPHSPAQRDRGRHAARKKDRRCAHDGRGKFRNIEFRLRPTRKVQSLAPPPLFPKRDTGARRHPHWLASTRVKGTGGSLHHCTPPQWHGRRCPPAGPRHRESESGMLAGPHRAASRKTRRRKLGLGRRGREIIIRSTPAAPKTLLRVLPWRRAIRVPSTARLPAATRLWLGANAARHPALEPRCRVFKGYRPRTPRDRGPRPATRAEPAGKKKRKKKRKDERQAGGSASENSVRVLCCRNKS